jgi:hypothetical protein
MRLIASPVALSSSICFVPHHFNTERETTVVVAKATATAMVMGNAGAVQDNSMCACFGQ